ncbi:hypothetical protein AB1Y20_007148 [Prymnesium parvum]|uniref:Uncharacterized protein n=1 Tax=Prymnesium parvum TaxID=97485 RepID=A0AB34IV96_PRYPA
MKALRRPAPPGIYLRRVASDGDAPSPRERYSTNGTNLAAEYAAPPAAALRGRNSSESAPCGVDRYSMGGTCCGVYQPFGEEALRAPSGRYGSNKQLQLPSNRSSAVSTGEGALSTCEEGVEEAFRNTVCSLLLSENRDTACSSENRHTAFSLPSSENRDAAFSLTSSENRNTECSLPPSENRDTAFSLPPSQDRDSACSVPPSTALLPSEDRETARENLSVARPWSGEVRAEIETEGGYAPAVEAQRAEGPGPSDWQAADALLTAASRLALAAVLEDHLRAAVDSASGGRTQAAPSRPRRKPDRWSLCCGEAPRRPAK